MLDAIVKSPIFVLEFCDFGILEVICGVDGCGGFCFGLINESVPECFELK